jgi:hypothetical protein
MTSALRSRLPATLFGVAGLLVQGCGQGLWDRASSFADAATSDDADVDVVVAPPGDDAAPLFDGGPKPPIEDVAKPNADLPKAEDGSKPQVYDGDSPGDETVSKTFDANGGTLTLPPATLTIGPNSFKDRTSVLVTMRRIESITHTGAYGPVIEITVPAAHLFRQTPRLTIQVPDLGPNQSFLPSAALGTLDPSRAPAEQWIVAYDSTLASDQKSVSGSVTDFENLTVVQFAVVLRCPTDLGCPVHQACNSTACQQCPTLNCP